MDPSSSLTSARPRVELPSPFRVNRFQLVTLVELRMRFYSGKIRAKPRWWEKIHDPIIAVKWRDEVDRKSVV